MNVSLTPQLEHLIRERVASGRYNNASEVVRDALRQMEERDRKYDVLRAMLVEADAQIDRGEYREWTPTLRDEMWQSAQEGVRSGRKPKSDVLP